MLCHGGGGATKKSARPVATRRADGGCGRSLRWSSSKMARHRLPSPALTSPRKPHLQLPCYFGIDHLVDDGAHHNLVRHIVGADHLTPTKKKPVVDSAQLGRQTINSLG